MLRLISFVKGRALICLTAAAAVLMLSSCLHSAKDLSPQQSQALDQLLRQTFPKVDFSGDSRVVYDQDLRFDMLFYAPKFVSSSGKADSSLYLCFGNPQIEGFDFDRKTCRLKGVSLFDRFSCTQGSMYIHSSGRTYLGIGGYWIQVMQDQIPKMQSLMNRIQREISGQCR